MGDSSRLRLKFWGVRGSIPTPLPHYLGHGGNTTCLEIRSRESLLVIDAGTGARNLGIQLQDESAGNPLRVNLLLTHFHWDHIQGLPFFAPLYSAANEVTFYSGEPAQLVTQILEGEMSNPYFPVNFEFLAASRKFVDVSRAPFRTADVCVHAFPLNHPQKATGYRIEAGGAVITHASDLEHGHEVLDKTLREYAQDADVLIYDAQYTPDEYPSRKGWGHSTWLEATRVARDCNVKRLILFHHDPGHDDARMDAIVKEARRHFDNTEAATETMEIVL